MKKFKIYLAPKAKKELNKTSAKNKERLFEALLELSADPYLGKPLVGRFKGHYSLRIGTSRIIYTISKKEIAVIIIRISHRKDAYK